MRRASSTSTKGHGHTPKGGPDALRMAGSLRHHDGGGGAGKTGGPWHPLWRPPCSRLATLLASLIGILEKRWKGGLEALRVLVRTLYGLPPVVVGVLVYLMLSNRGPLAELDLLFTVPAMVLAQNLLAFGLGGRGRPRCHHERSP